MSECVICERQVPTCCAGMCEACCSYHGDDVGIEYVAELTAVESGPRLLVGLPRRPAVRRWIERFL